jgi:hypothetical protein
MRVGEMGDQHRRVSRGTVGRIAHPTGKLCD